MDSFIIEEISKYMELYMIISIAPWYPKLYKLYPMKNFTDEEIKEVAIKCDLEDLLVKSKITCFDIGKYIEYIGSNTMYIHRHLIIENKDYILSLSLHKNDRLTQFLIASKAKIPLLRIKSYEDLKYIRYSKDYAVAHNYLTEYTLELYKSYQGDYLEIDIVKNVTETSKSLYEVTLVLLKSGCRLKKDFYKSLVFMSNKDLIYKYKDDLPKLITKEDLEYLLINVEYNTAFIEYAIEIFPLHKILSLLRRYPQKLKSFKSYIHF